MLFNVADVEAIMKIKIPSRLADDFLAWQLEKSGIFSVRSAYNLAFRLTHMQDTPTSSSNPGGERKLWAHVWGGRVPPKVNVFTWKLAKDMLPTRRAKFVRHLEVGDRCLLCDRDTENSYHAVVACPQAQGLRAAMREHWPLPEEEQFSFTGPDWLLLLLDRCSPTQRDLVKLVLWRAWLTHNNITHQSGPVGIHAGVQALLSMSTLIEQGEVGHVEPSSKGKKPMHACKVGSEKVKERADSNGERRWKPPPPGWTKINVDGSYAPASETAGVGVVARNSLGEVVFTAWRVLIRCADAAEAEARACVEGFRLASQWASTPVIVESDCARIVEAMRRGVDRSDIGFCRSRSTRARPSLARVEDSFG